MEDRGAPDTDAALLSDAYATARELIRQAEEDAARIRVEADRYRRQREQEAELIVGKARRLLMMAEERAAAPRPLVVDVDAAAPVARAGDEHAVSDVDAVAGAGAGAGAVAPERAESALDAILAAAVSNAVHRALPSDP